MNTLIKFLRISRASKACLLTILASIFVYSCTRDEASDSEFAVNNSLSLFKLDNKNNDADLKANDTVVSQSGVSGKFIPVSGAAGAAKGLETITMELRTMNDSLLNTVTLTSFFKPEYHTINSQLIIPASQRGKVYKVVVKAVDKAGTTIGTKTFFGMDVVTCDPLPPCLVANQISVIVETPTNTPDNESIYLFGSLNGWNRGDVVFKLNKNPDVPNCYCVTVPFPPGYGDWMLGEIYVTRGQWANDAVKADGSTFIARYADSDRGPIWKIKVAKWRDR